MTREDFTQLNKMHHEIKKSGMTAFDTAYLERYTRLFARSLEGKGDRLKAPVSST